MDKNSPGPSLGTEAPGAKYSFGIASRYNPVVKSFLPNPAALILAIPVAAQFPPAPIVTTNIADVDKHVAAAKTAAGTEWVGLYTAACGDAVGLSQRQRRAAVALVPGAPAPAVDEPVVVRQRVAVLPVGRLQPDRRARRGTSIR